jgi:hypothetical protein
MTALPSLQSATALAIAAHLDGKAPYKDGESLRVTGLATACDRRLWYAYRWAHKSFSPEARQRRLIESDMSRKTEIITLLMNAGLKVQTRDPQNWFKYSARMAGGHLTAFFDGTATMVPEAPVTTHLLQVRIYSRKDWENWRRKGIRESEPSYFIKAQLGMRALGLTRALVVAENRDTKEIEAERINYDAALATSHEARAERIAVTDSPPARISDDPDFWECRFCPAREVCHEAQQARRNCRTCLASCVSEGGWGCARHGVDLSAEEQRQGCAVHLYIPDLVPGEQIDADEAACTVTYRMPDGSTWIDGPQVSEPRLDAPGE